MNMPKNDVADSNNDIDDREQQHTDADAIGVGSVISQSAETIAGILNDVSNFPEVFQTPTPSLQGDETDHDEYERQDEPIEEEEEEEWKELDFGESFELSIRKEILGAIKERILSNLTPDLVLLRDKITFTIGTLDLFISAFWLGHAPQTFHYLYTVKATVMLFCRWAYYRHTRQHYYLFDMCYASQALLLVQIYWFPTSIILAKMTFAFSMGPLLWSILAFRNSLVLHSFDKVTSLFLHWFPACVVWAFRWHPIKAMENSLQNNPERRHQWEAATFFELCIVPMGPYLCWAVLYYLKIFVISSEKIKNRGYETLFEYVTTRRGIFSAFVLRFPRAMQPIAYIVLHMVLTVVAMSFNTLYWKYKIAGSGIVLAAFALAAWNGACFYFDIFAHRYLAGLGIESDGGRSRKKRYSAASPVLDESNMKTD